MWKKLVLAGLFPAVGLALLTAAEPRPEPGMPCRCRCVPRHQTYTGNLVRVVSSGGVSDWVLRDGKGTWTLRFDRPEIEKRAEQFAGKRVTVKGRAVVSGLLVHDIEA